MLLKEHFLASGFEWDAGNRSKNALKHGLSTDEIEVFLLGEVSVAEDPLHSASEKRWFAVGRDTQGRALLTVFTLRQGLIRPISARRMHAKEILWYESQNKTDA